MFGSVNALFLVLVLVLCFGLDSGFLGDEVGAADNLDDERRMMKYQAKAQDVRAR